MVTRGAGTQHRTTEGHRLSARPRREGEMTVESVCAGVGGQGGYRTGGVSRQISIKSGPHWGMRGPRKRKGRGTPKGSSGRGQSGRGQTSEGAGKGTLGASAFRSKSSFLRPPLRSLPPAQPPSPALAPDNPPQIPSRRPPPARPRPVTGPLTTSHQAQRIPLPGRHPPFCAPSCQGAGHSLVQLVDLLLVVAKPWRKQQKQCRLLRQQHGMPQGWVEGTHKDAVSLA